jgi:N-acetylmuramoyl-L-alanine amidase
VRITLELNREVPYQTERIVGPDRVFVDLPRTRPVAALRWATLPFPDDVVRRVRIGAQPDQVTRVVLDLEGGGRHSVYTLYNPYRIVVDVERLQPESAARPVSAPTMVRATTVPVATAGAARGVERLLERPVERPVERDTERRLEPALESVPAPPIAPAPSAAVKAVPVATPVATPVTTPVTTRTSGDEASEAGVDVTTTPTAPPVAAALPPTLPAAVSATVPSSRPAAPLATPPAAPLATAAEGLRPTAPAVNTRGRFSLSRQLGLGIARIVIDAGHGGRDSGARVKGGLSEADLTLDVALRLETLLQKQAGVEVIQTRRTNSYVALEERTEIANRSEADLFISIHVNASADRRARGVETYFLNFAPNAAAESIAARENAGANRQMRQLPDLVKAIAMNNKIDESRDLAAMVQQSLFNQVRKSDRQARNLGVKQAPFMVLVGASMPSILTEISFVTNQQDAGLLATEKYRQQIAEALLGGITRYQQSLKKATAVAAQ